MKIRILAEAQQDLIDGFRFYEDQQVGLGDYFLDTLFSDIDSLQLFAATHPSHFVTVHRCGRQSTKTA
ncbi:MAG: hypothetical protein R6W72_13485 [Desulfurivibrionaceae bacterium]